MTNRLTIEEVERCIETFSKKPDPTSEYYVAVYRQLADTMRENEELKRYPLKMICEKCNVLTDVEHPNKESV